MSRDDLVAVLRVEVLKLVDRSSDHFAHLSQVQLLADHEGVDAGRDSHCLRLDAVFLVILQRIECSHESGYIRPCLSWQVWPYVPELTASACSLDGFPYVSCSTVV